MSDLERLAQRTGQELGERGLSLATAESCTGGWVAQTVTAIAGSSGWFDRGFVTYSNESKVEMLGVPQETLDRHGAVSEETARAMAQGVLARSRADWALSITGIAGPSGGSPGKPVGTVCFAWARRSGACDSVTEHFGGGRAEVRERSVRRALDGLLERVARPDPGRP